MAGERNFDGGCNAAGEPVAGEGEPEARVAAWLRAGRQRAGLSQRELAKRSGIAQSVLGRLELAQSPVAARDERTIRALARALGGDEGDEAGQVRALALAGVWPAGIGLRALAVALLIERLSDRDRDLVIALAEGMASTSGPVSGGVSSPVSGPVSGATDGRTTGTG